MTPLFLLLFTGNLQLRRFVHRRNSDLFPEDDRKEQRDDDQIIAIVAFEAENVNRDERPIAVTGKEQQHPAAVGTMAPLTVRQLGRRNTDLRAIVGLGMQTRADDLRTLGRQRKGEYVRRIGDVLQAMLSEVDELGGNHPPNMAPGIGRDADPAGRGEALETRGQIDMMAVDVVRRDDHIAEIDPHAELDAAALRHCGIAGEHQPLHLQGTANRVDHAAEFGERPVTSVFDDPAAMLADFWLDHLAPMSSAIRG